MTFCYGGFSAGLLAWSFFSPHANQTNDRSLPGQITWGEIAMIRFSHCRSAQDLTKLEFADHF
jgi:hypothetical protein